MYVWQHIFLNRDFVSWLAFLSSQKLNTEENLLDMNSLTCIMLYDTTFCFLLSHERADHTTHVIQSEAERKREREREWVTGSEIPAKQEGEKRKGLDLKCMCETPLNSWSRCEEKLIIYSAWLSSFFMVICSIIGKHYMIALVAWVAARGVTWGNCTGLGSNPLHLLVH